MFGGQQVELPLDGGCAAQHGFDDVQFSRGGSIRSFPGHARPTRARRSNAIIFGLSVTPHVLASMVVPSRQAARACLGTGHLVVRNKHVSGGGWIST